MKHILVILFCFFSTLAYSNCDDHYAAGVPIISNKATTKLCRIGYNVEHFNKCKAPLFVMQYLSPENLGGLEPRQTFKADPDLGSSGARPSDYAKSGYDMGHMAPAADFKSNSAMILQSFYLSNAVPQNPNLNRGTWRSLEIRTRALALKQNGLFVYTGAIYRANASTIGTGVCVPSHTYKILIDPAANESLAYLIPNKAGVGSYKNYATTLSNVEKKTGINFAPELSIGVKGVLGVSLLGK